MSDPGSVDERRQRRSQAEREEDRLQDPPESPDQLTRNDSHHHSARNAERKIHEPEGCFAGRESPECVGVQSIDHPESDLKRGEHDAGEDASQQDEPSSAQPKSQQYDRIT